MTPANRIGQLAVGGDWACAHGDSGALACLARELAEYAGEPLHCELIALAELCTTNPELAAARWPDLREVVYRATRCGRPS